jgi:hypothetical protein
LNGLDIADAYRNELQKIRGFEVMPVGVVEQLLIAHNVRIDESTDFQDLAAKLNVDALVVGSVTDFSEFYPPRMGLAVNWYAANRCLHPIPAGYGLPWNTAEEEFIPDSLLLEAEFALAREQLKSQTPVDTTHQDSMPIPAEEDPESPEMIEGVSGDDGLQAYFNGVAVTEIPLDPQIPPNWPNEGAFCPRPPSPTRPRCIPHYGPIIELVKQYNGSDADFTHKLANYYIFRDDRRAGGWQSYLQRKDDFIGFCCYLHITEMLAARGGAGETRVVWRWPTSRYDR